jgi:L-ribulokinase
VHLANSGKRYDIPGIYAYTKNGIIPGNYIYESGQAGCGDSFDWFVKNCVPASYQAEADERNISIHALLREKASRLIPGESGLLALDWWNGSRSPLKNDYLSGTILGLTITTKPEEIYRAMIEATAYGARQIFEDFENGGMVINSVTAAGGIALKDPMMMQIYADVAGRTIRVARTAQAGARGSAVMGSVAAGLFENVEAAAAHFDIEPAFVYTPNPEHHEIYNTLYAEYRRLHDYFGRHGNDVMQHLSDLSKAVRTQHHE